MVTEGLRWVNVGLSVCAAAAVIMIVSSRWVNLTGRWRRVGVGASMVLLVIAYGSGEAASQHVPPGLRVGMMLVALCVLVGSLVWHFNEDG